MEGFDGSNQHLWLKVTVRQQDCPLARQPVLSRKLNLSTDPVQPSRTADSLALELIPELPPSGPEQRYDPWGSHTPVADALPPLSDLEQQTLDELELSNPQAHAQLSLHTRLLHALDASGLDTVNLADELEDGARLLLARIRIDASDIDNIVVNPQRIQVNNLVRPFLTTASQLAWLNRQT